LAVERGTIVNGLCPKQSRRPTCQISHPCCIPFLSRKALTVLRNYLCTVLETEPAFELFGAIAHRHLSDGPGSIRHYLGESA
jgi:hypothetical protein